MKPPVLIHLHIPKNAGTSLSRALKLRLLGKNPLNWLRKSDVLGKYDVHPWERRLEAIESSPRAAARVRFFEAHAGFGMHERLPEPHRYLTVLREPVDRALSIYHYLAQTGERDRTESIDDFIARRDPIGRVWHIDNAQVRYLAAERGVIDSRPPEQCDRAMLDTAIDRLRNHIDHIIVQSRFDEGLLVLAHELGWPDILYSKSNVTKSRRSADETDPAIIERLREMNTLDAELFAVAQDIFDQKLAAFIATLAVPFEDRLAQYRGRLDAYGKRSGPIYRAIKAAGNRRKRKGKRAQR